MTFRVDKQHRFLLIKTERCYVIMFYLLRDMDRKNFIAIYPIDFHLIND